MNTTDVIWKPILKYDGYWASNFGEIKSKNKVLHKHISNGYYRTGLHVGEKQITIKVSILVALAWHPNPENKRTVNHKDTNKLNDCEWNLEWNTHLENLEHARVNNLIVWDKGIDCHQSVPVAKLDKDGNITDVFETMVSAAKSVNRKHPSLFAYLNGQTKHCAGFQWKKITKELYSEIIKL